MSPSATCPLVRCPLLLFWKSGAVHEGCNWCAKLTSHLTLQELADLISLILLGWLQGLSSKHLKDVLFNHFSPHSPHFQKQHHPCSVWVATGKSAQIYGNVLYPHWFLFLFLLCFSSIKPVLAESQEESRWLKLVSVDVRGWTGIFQPDNSCRCVALQSDPNQGMGAAVPGQRLVSPLQLFSTRHALREGSAVWRITTALSAGGENLPHKP